MPKESVLQRGGVDFSRFVLRGHQKKIELAGVQLFARTAKHPADEQVHLLAKQFDFLMQTGVLFSQLMIFFKKLLFAQFLHCFDKEAGCMLKYKQPSVLYPLVALIPGRILAPRKSTKARFHQNTGSLEHLRNDNGAEFIASCMQDWLKAQEIKTLYIKPGSPSENGHTESFHDKLRDECLNRELFGNLREARYFGKAGVSSYNERRPHSALGYQTPSEYAGRKTNRFDGGCAPPNPAPLAAASVRGKLQINATKWQINENQNIKEPAERHL